jgi:hypothetical protein
MRRVIALFALTLAAGVACGGPPPSGSPSPSPSNTVATPAPARTTTPTPTPVAFVVAPARPIASPPTDELPLTASAEGDGVRVAITLERNPMPAGEPTWVTTEVRNIGDDDLLYADDCSLVGVSGAMTGTRWRPGVAFTGRMAEYKAWAIESRALADGTIWIGFTPEGIVDRGLEAGEYGCGDVLVVSRLRPGESRTERARWMGLAMLSYAPPPGGDITLTGVFSFFWRSSEEDPDPPQASGRRLEVPLATWIGGVANPPRVDPTEAIDLAVTDPVFGPWVLARPFRSGADWTLRFDSIARQWRVGLLSYYPEPRTREVLIDAGTGLTVGYEGPVD